ncbi:MAG TPA: hypothetical protein VHZ30_07195 [Verrucomicrobiae bacterium]|jgi:hypothetical protein|nr:hypothetical protein [Verrucomicrobiae bacterium]
MNSESALERYTPLLCWIASVLTVLFICFKIIGTGYLPGGDARRHVAKPFAGKPYSEIVVMRPEYVVDHSPGWEGLLGVLHRAFDWNEDALMSFSIGAMLLCVIGFPLIWVRHPEAWLAAVLAELIALPELMTRWTQARPYLLTEGVLMALLFSWHKEDGVRPPWWKIAATSVGFCLSVWIHGAWYLWVLLFAAFFLAQRWRTAFWLAGCWVVGVIVGALLTGKPLAFLNGAIFMAKCVQSEHVPKWMLVGEFQPSMGEFASVALLAIIYLWRRRGNNAASPLATDPVVWMIAINWVLAFSADRFWADWGLAAAVVWMAMQFDQELPALWGGVPLKRLVLCGMIALPLYLDATNDYSRRYSNSLNDVFVDANDPKLEGWMPGHGGIFYSATMKFFYNTFFKNPQGDWRYIAGFEPALMPPDDLTVYRTIQRAPGNLDSYEPWIKKMRPQDRLEIDMPYEPPLPALEWKHAAGDVWIGRLPSTVKSPHTEH